jgi:hypothetical protein
VARKNMTATDYPQKIYAGNSPGLHYSALAVLLHPTLCKSITYALKNSKTQVESAKLG